MGQDFIDGAVLCSIYVLFSLGLTLSWGALDVLNLAHGAVMMFGVFIAYEITLHVRLPLALLFVIGIATAGLCTLLLDVLIFQPIKRKVPDKRQAELLILIAGSGAAAIPVTIAQAQTSDEPFGIGHLNWTTWHFGGTTLSILQVAIVVVGVGLCVGVAFWVSKARSGRALRAVAFDSETAELMGVNTRLLSAVTMLIAGAMAGLAGVLLVIYLGALTPESGDTFLLKGFAIIILGSVGSIWGTLAGAAVLAAGETIVTATTSGTWTDAISFAIIIVIILIRPSGIFGRGMAERV
jgi:branched-chain amino acid transport system permease protein